MIPRDLLWQAFPMGFLPLRGCGTLDGWTCIGHAPGWGTYRNPNEPLDEILVRFDNVAAGMLHNDDVDTMSLSIRNTGNLLPLVDPDEPATWACCLYDLAVHLGLKPEERTGLRLDAPWNYGEPWDLSYHPTSKAITGEDYPNPTDVCTKAIPGVMYGDALYAQEAELAVPTTQNPALALVLGLAHLKGPFVRSGLFSHPPKITGAQFKALVSEGQALRKVFDAQVAGMRGPR